MVPGYEYQGTRLQRPRVSPLHKSAVFQVVFEIMFVHVDVHVDVHTYVRTYVRAADIAVELEPSYTVMSFLLATPTSFPVAPTECLYFESFLSYVTYYTCTVHVYVRTMVSPLRARGRTYVHVYVPWYVHVYVPWYHHGSSTYVTNHERSGFLEICHTRREIPPCCLSTGVAIPGSLQQVITTLPGTRYR
jgi:hypothetical protein